jgi:hypothetical protein
MSLTVIQKTEYYTICRCYIAYMTVVGDTPDIDFRYMRVFLFCRFLIASK